MANTLIPIDPSGTSPISTRRFDSRSHSNEPVPMPSENVASKMVTTSGLAESTSFAKLKKEVRNVAPTNHSHEMPRRLRNTVRSDFASLRLRHVSDTGFQLMRNSGCDASDLGTNAET